MFTAGQLVAHMVGDYLVQSHVMATKKTRSSFWAAVHAVTYALPFMLAIIAGTHFAIDRWRLARYVVWARNKIGGGTAPWSECRETGMPADVPPYLAVWVLILCDNTLHILINGLTLWGFP